jgi:hypothetical protein
MQPMKDIRAKAKLRSIFPQPLPKRLVNSPKVLLQCPSMVLLNLLGINTLAQVADAA